MPDLPSVHVTTDDVTDLDVDALIVPVFRGSIEGPGADTALRALGLDGVPRDAGFRARTGETLHLAAPGLAWGRVVLVGLGRLDQLSDETVRRAAGAATRAIARDATTAATTLPLVNASSETIRAVAEGAMLGTYQYDEARSEPRPQALRDLSLIIPSSLSANAQDAVRRAAVHARAQCVARDLVTTPPNRLGPSEFVDIARGVLDETVDLEVWDEDRLVDERCGGLLAVGRGSDRSPRLLRLRYSPTDPVASIALVGKGITFDSGGISLKRPSKFMESMKGDLAGAAAVLGVMSVLAELDIPVAVSAELCLAENLPGGDAQRPSDVITMRNGTTVEVRDTDAEGRLVLADGLVLAAESNPDAIVDVATLTGAASRAIGQHATALFANDDDLLRQLLQAADAAGEATWHLPLWEELRDELESEVADIDNLGGNDTPGATMGGLFLREFVDGLPWAHLDIAGPFWRDEARNHLSAHGTGVGVRTLLRWLEAAQA